MENARSLVKSAQAVSKLGGTARQHSSYGHATALLALAQEEYFKAVSYASVANGFSVISSKPVKGAYPIHPSELLCHHCKQEQAAWLFITGYARELRLPEGATMDEHIEDLKKLLTSSIPKGEDGRILGMGVPPEKVAEVRKFLQLVANLGGIKETGLYVDLQRGKVRSPDAFPRKLYELIEKVVEGPVLAQHQFEDPSSPELSRGLNELRPAKEEVVAPRPCRHKGGPIGILAVGIVDDD